MSTIISTLPGAVEAYLLSRTTAGLSPLTISRYRKALSALPDEWPLTALTLVKHIASFRERLSPSSVSVEVASIRAFTRWAVSAGLFDRDPAAGMTVKVPRRLPRVPIPDEVAAMLRACRTPRERALVLVLVDTGLRISELCRLRWEDVQPATRTIRVMGKGAKERTVHYSATTAHAITRHQSSISLIQPESWVFPATAGQRVRRAAVDRTLRAISVRAVGHPISAHKLRHYFGTEMVRHGADLESVRILMGHSTLAMVLRYVHLVGADLARAHRRASPAEWLDRG